jgi:hypothetical protein
MNIYPPLNTNSQSTPINSQRIQNQPAVQGYILPQNNNFQEKKFSKVYVIVQIVFLVVLCIAMFAIQIVMIVNHFPTYFAGPGIWVAVYFIGAIICLSNMS